MAKAKADIQPEVYRTMRDLWDRASRAQIELEREGEEVTPTSIWNKMGIEGDPPRTLVAAMDHDGYKQIVDIRRRLVVIPALNNLGILRDLCSQGAYMALASALEDLVLHPEKVTTRDKISLSKTLTDMHMRITPGEGADAEREGMTDAAVDEEQQMEAALALIPEGLRASMRDLYIKERAKHLQDRRALHLVELNKPMSHANVG